MASKKVASSHCFSMEQSWNMKFIEKGVEIMDQVAMAYKWHNLCPQQELKGKKI